MPSSHLIFCCPLLLPPIPPSIGVFSSESALHMRWPKYWSFLFSINPSNEHPGLISFRMDRLDLLAVQGTLKSLLQHHSSKASILRRSVGLFNSLSFSFIFWAWCFLHRSNRTVIVVVILTPHQKCSVLFRYTALVIWCSLTMSYSPHSQPLIPSQFFFYLCEWGHRDKYGYVL